MNATTSFARQDSGRLVHTMNSCIAKKEVSDSECLFWQYVIYDEESELQNWFTIRVVMFEETMVTLN